MHRLADAVSLLQRMSVALKQKLSLCRRSTVFVPTGDMRGIVPNARVIPVGDTPGGCGGVMNSSGRVLDGRGKPT